MAKNIKSDREKYNPNDRNRYRRNLDPDKEGDKPPRYDLRNRHRRIKDELDIAEENKEKEMNRTTPKNQSKTKLAVKSILAKRKLAKNQNDPNHSREGIENFKFQETGLKQIAQTYKHLAEAYNSMVLATNMFSRCKSSEISPDGKLGGRGYILGIRDIRNAMSQCVNAMSDLIDTFHDEVSSPYWKKTTVEDHPSVKELLSEANEIADKAEDMEESGEVLNDREKNKVKSILQKKWGM